MRLCRPGTLIPFMTVALLSDRPAMRPFVHLSMPALIVGWPTMSTATTRSRYGSHAMKTSPAACARVVSVASWSPSSRMIVFGFQSFSTPTITMMHVSELRMSVSSGPTRLDTSNCAPANETPHAAIAGSTCMARSRPAMTTTR